MSLILVLTLATQRPYKYGRVVLTSHYLLDQPRCHITPADCHHSFARPCRLAHEIVCERRTIRKLPGGAHECGECAVRKSTHSAARHHHESHHQENQKCPDCGISVKRTDNLKRHRSMCTSTVKMGRNQYVINAMDDAPGNDDFEPEEQSSSRDVEVQINNQLYSEDLVKIARDALAKQPLNEEGFV